MANAGVSDAGAREWVRRGVAALTWASWMARESIQQNRGSKSEKVIDPGRV